MESMSSLVVLRFAGVACGAWCVTTCGAMMTQQWSAGNWTLLVSSHHIQRTQLDSKNIE